MLQSPATQSLQRSHSPPQQYLQTDGALFFVVKDYEGGDQLTTVLVRCEMSSCLGVCIYHGHQLLRRLQRPADATRYARFSRSQPPCASAIRLVIPNSGIRSWFPRRPRQRRDPSVIWACSTLQANGAPVFCTSYFASHLVCFCSSLYSLS